MSQLVGLLTNELAVALDHSLHIKAVMVFCFLMLSAFIIPYLLRTKPF